MKILSDNKVHPLTKIVKKEKVENQFKQYGIYLADKTKGTHLTIL